jgi:hypothetical protein
VCGCIVETTLLPGEKGEIRVTRGLGRCQLHESLERRLRALVGADLDRRRTRMERRYRVNVLGRARFRRGCFAAAHEEQRCQQRPARDSQRPVSL